MNEMQVFTNEQFGQVRTVLIGGNPWFVGADVCRALEIDKTQSRRLDEDEKGLYLTHTPGGNQNLLYVNESGLYDVGYELPEDDGEEDADDESQSYSDDQDSETDMMEPDAEDNEPI